MLDPDLLAARARAEAARTRLIDSASTLQTRIAPKRLAADAIESAKERGAAMLDDTAAVVRRRPTWAVAGAVGLVALLARKRIVRLFRRKPARQTLVYHAQNRALPRPKGDKK